METVASFFLLLIVYFLGCLSLVLLVIKPQSKLVEDGSTKKKYWISNYFKIILLSFSISLMTTVLAFFLFGI